MAGRPAFAGPARPCERTHSLLAARVKSAAGGPICGRAHPCTEPHSRQIQVFLPRRPQAGQAAGGGKFTGGRARFRRPGPSHESTSPVLSRGASRTCVRHVQRCRRWTRWVAGPSLPEPHSRLFVSIQPASTPALRSVLFRRRKNPPGAEAVSPPPPPWLHSRSLTREKSAQDSVVIESLSPKPSSTVGQEKSAENGSGFPAASVPASFEEPDERKAC